MVSGWYLMEDNHFIDINKTKVNSECCMNLLDRIFQTAYMYIRVLVGMHVFHIKGTHTIYFGSSLYIINQKPRIPRIHFHYITTWLHALLGEIRPCICLFCGFGLLARFGYYLIYSMSRMLFSLLDQKYSFIE